MSVGVRTRTRIRQPLAGLPDMRVGDLGGFPQALGSAWRRSNSGNMPGAVRHVQSREA
jgi:hypothetical protein